MHKNMENYLETGIILGLVGLILMILHDLHIPGYHTSEGVSTSGHLVSTVRRL